MRQHLTRNVFIICTEMGVLYELKQKNLGKNILLCRTSSVLSKYEAYQFRECKRHIKRHEESGRITRRTAIKC